MLRYVEIQFYSPLKRMGAFENGVIILLGKPQHLHANGKALEYLLTQLTFHVSTTRITILALKNLHVKLKNK